MVREDILNWLKGAIADGENANDAAIRLIVAGHDMYEVNDALRQITHEIADEKFAINKIQSFKENKVTAPKPRPYKEIPELPKVEVVNKGMKFFSKFSKKNLLFWIWALIGTITAILLYLLYTLIV